MKKIKVDSPIKTAVPVIIILLALVFFIGYIWIFIATSDYFKIKDIIAKGLDPADFSYLKGKNIFSVDLGSESRHLLQFYPESSRIILIRVLPDRLFVGSVKRKAVAIVKLNRYFALDENGTLFSVQDQPGELGLPLIGGLEGKLAAPRIGRKYNVRELELALNLLREIRKNRILRNFRIKKINVAGADEASVILILPQIAAAEQKTQMPAEPQGLEVKIGLVNIKEKIAILSGVVSQSGGELSNIKYVDLRFKDPVIKFRDAKSK